MLNCLTKSVLKASLGQDQQREIQVTNRLAFNGLESGILIQIFQEYHYFLNESHLELNSITKILREETEKKLVFESLIPPEVLGKHQS